MIQNTFLFFLFTYNICIEAIFHFSSIAFHAAIINHIHIPWTTAEFGIGDTSVQIHDDVFTTWMVTRFPTTNSNQGTCAFHFIRVLSAVVTLLVAVKPEVTTLFYLLYATA